MISLDYTAEFVKPYIDGRLFRCSNVFLSACLLSYLQQYCEKQSQ